MPMQRFTQLHYFFKVNNGNTKTMCKICSKLTVTTRTTCCFGVSFFYKKRLRKNYLKKWLCEFHVPKFCSTMCYSWAQEPVFRKVFVNFTMKIFRHNLQEQTLAILLIENLAGTNFCDYANRKPCRNKLSRLC